MKKGYIIATIWFIIIVVIFFVFNNIKAIKTDYLYKIDSLNTVIEKNNEKYNLLIKQLDSIDGLNIKYKIKIDSLIKKSNKIKINHEENINNIIDNSIGEDIKFFSKRISEVKDL